MKDMRGRKLPVDVHAFEIMREGNYVYVDKTQHIYKMVNEGHYYFLSRPRRFGKTLLVSTLKCLFQGRKELFEGLWIAEHGDWEWKTHPVITLSLNEISARTPEMLEANLSLALKHVASDYDVELETPFVESQFQELILKLAKKTRESVAVLIDEYDKPIIDHLGKGPKGVEVAKANRDLLKSVFGVLKGLSVAPILRLVFLTGISRFSKVSIFSELNNLIDISMDDAFADIVGYTQVELESYFYEQLLEFAESQKSMPEQILVQLAEQYDGYRFSERDCHVYNPYSILRAFRIQKFQNYWFESATPSFLINLLRHTHYNLPKIEQLQVGRSIFNAFDLDRLQPEALLFQTGYLTIKDVQDKVYTLNYPNQEVKTAFTESLLSVLAEEGNAAISSHVLRLSTYLRRQELDAFFQAIRSIFAAIPYDIESKRDEAYFHTIFYLAMTASGANAQSSVLTSDGRIDLVVQFPGLIYIIEFECKQSADAALQQIRDKGYVQPYRQSGKSIFLIGINFSTEQRNLAEWRIEQP